MAEVQERIFEIAKDAIAQQERQVADMRTRGATLLAAGGVVAGILARPAFHDHHPHAFGEWATMAVGLAGAAVLLVAIAVMAWPRDLAFTFRAVPTYEALFRRSATEQPMLDIQLAFTLADAYDANETSIRWIRWSLWAAIAGLIAIAGGLPAAAGVSS